MTICATSGFDIISNLIIGIIASTIVAIATYIIVNRKQTQDLRKKYGKAAGHYFGFGLEKDLDEHGVQKRDDDGKLLFKTTLEDKPCSEATIRYVPDTNFLDIHLKELSTKYEWQGQIFMELESKGSIAWRYIGFPKTKEGKEQHIFGLKRCIVRDDAGDNKIYVYLIGEKGYGKEILVRDK